MGEIEKLDWNWNTSTKPKADVNSIAVAIGQHLVDVNWFVGVGMIEESAQIIIVANSVFDRHFNFDRAYAPAVLCDLWKRYGEEVSIYIEVDGHSNIYRMVDTQEMAMVPHKLFYDSINTLNIQLVVDHEVS